MALFSRKDKPEGASEVSRFRTFGIFIVSVALIIGALTYWYYRRATAGIEAGAEVAAAATTPVSAAEAASPEYVRLIRQRNIEQARRAALTGESAIATAVRPSYFDSGDFQGRAKKGCSVEELKRAREAGVTAFELRCKGCSAAALKAAGYTAGELAAAGYSAAELKAAGFTAKQLRAAGFSAAELKRAGFDVSDLAAAGYTPAELAAAGFTPDQLRFAGLSDAELAAAGIGVGKPANMPKNCSVPALRKARADGISAAQLKKMGCGAAALKAAGYTAAELKAAGFTAAQLKAAGFTAAQLRNAGFTAGDLLKAGFTPKELKDAGFTAKELRQAGVSAGDLLAAGFTPEQLRKAGFSEGDLLRAGVAPPKPTVAAVDAKKAACDVQTLRTLRSQGVKARALKALGCKTAQLQAAGYTAAEIAGLPTPTTPVGVGPPPLQPGAIEPPIGGTEEEQFLRRLQKRQEAQLTAQQREDELQKISQAMRSNASNLFANWVPPPLQQYQEAAPPKKKEEQQQQAAPEQLAEGKPGEEKKPKGPTITLKAGTIIYGVLDAGVNSDENSPVLATVVMGKLKTSRLMGKFKLLRQRLLISFDKMSIPWANASISVQVVAVDPETARTALAHHVNNHYFLRYGTLFASSFLSGLGNAIGQAGSQTSSGAGGVVTTFDRLNPTEKFLVALGEVGTQYANVLGENFRRKPTVTVEAGQGVGLLFMEDATLPLPNPLQEVFHAG